MPDEGPVLARVLLGLRLRELRRVRRMTAGQAADGISVSAEAINWLESGCAPVSLHEVIDLCELYGVADLTERTTLLSLAREANVAGWWDRYKGVVPAWHLPYLGFEHAARVIRAVGVQSVHDLLQTREYARAQLEQAYPLLTDSEIELRVELRMARQHLLHRDAPPHLWVLAEESSLRRPAGSRATMFRQLEHLIDLCDLPRVTVQIIPFGRSVPAVNRGAFTLLSLRGFSVPGSLPDLVYLQQLTTGLYLDSHPEVERYRHAHHALATSAAVPASQTQSRLLRISREL
ncbi:DUF5753 domain-containing protein [Actinomadura fulvescens]|uniref:DUF5753 domain-containing protein n=1 Tax=Actinomadura fulvescens TaxID=46160 RepID=UPI0031D8306A